jgi:SAM-dependent methyltransferase
MDVVDLQDFYASPLGKATHRVLAARLASGLAAHQPTSSDARILGLGYATPYLDGAPGQMAFMLARRGVVHWPPAGQVQSALVDEYDLPLPDNSVDLVLVIHGLEFTDEPVEMLQEVWRVLAPQGRLLLVVPNRRGLWSLSDSSPFGFGQPFSRLQLLRHLKDAQFSLSRIEGALFMPPWGKGAVLKLSFGLEKFGAAALGHFSGALVVEATKHIYAYASGRKRLRSAVKIRPALLGRPQPSHAQSHPRLGN